MRARMPLTSGTKLGPYEILSPLGAGGMGEVYLARDTRLGRDVAIKVLPAHLSSDPDLKQRMEREARAISSLNHPHICTLHDIGSQDGINFLVMEHLEGETLADRLQRGTMALDEALKIGIQVAEALDKAHARGIVHRDLKPANIMLTKNGPKLMDFGLAKPTAFSSTSGSSPLTPSTPTMTVAELTASASPLTQKGTVVGTVQYMAPEVLQGAEADARSDIFSFGCVLYEMFTGRRAFEGKSQFSVLGAILDQEPDRISAVRPSSPLRLDETVRRCLAKNPEQRYGCMHDVRIQLEALTEAGPQATGAQTESLKPSPAGSWLPWLVAGIAALIALSVGAAYVFQAPKPAPVVRSSILPPTGVVFVTMLPASGPPVLSPDGTQLAFTGHDDKGKVLLYVRALNSVTAQPLAGTDDATYPFWSPDSRELGYFVPAKLKRISAGGGPSQTICDAASGRGGAWSANGVIVFTPATSSPLFRVSVQGGTPEAASKLDAARTENSHRWPAFLPDGKHFLFWARSSRSASSGMTYIGEVGSLQARQLTNSDSIALYASGHLLFVRQTALMAQAFDLRKLQLSGEAVPVVENIMMNGTTSRAVFSASATGAMIYQSGDTFGGWNLVWFDREGKQLGSLAQPDRYLFPALSPDGSHLAVMIYVGATGAGDIWNCDLIRGTRTRLTFGPANQTFPVWSADAKTIFHSSNGKGMYHIYAKSADGSGEDRPVLESANMSEIPGASSPDGRYLVYTRREMDNNAGSHIWALPLTGGGKPFPVVQTAFDEDWPSISPDSKWMAYQSTESGRREIYITAFPGGGAKWQVSNNGGTTPKWRRDGKELFFVDGEEKIQAVDVNTSGNAIHLGIPHALFQAFGLQREYGPYDVTADGKKFLLNSGNLKEGSAPMMLVMNWPEELKK